MHARCLVGVLPRMIGVSDSLFMSVGAYIVVCGCECLAS